MKKTRMTTKTLSMLLTVIMLFTTISVGFIVPEAQVNAEAATYDETFTLTGADTVVDDLEDAIEYANDNRKKTVLIQLTNDITVNGKVSAFTPIDGNVVFDFNGKKLTFEYSISGEYGSDNDDCQIPVDNVDETHDSKDLVPYALLSFTKNSTLQFINSGTADGLLSVKAHFEDKKKNDDCGHLASVSIIESAGTLILGDMTDATKNNFTISAHAHVRNGNTDSGGGNKDGTAKAMAVTINGSAAIFKMYGGTIEASGYVRARRNSEAEMRIYPLNINACASAEIYGGNINIPFLDGYDRNGISNPRYDALDGANVMLAAIRANSSNLFVFNVSSKVNGYVGTNTGSGNSITLTNVYSVGSNLPAIYGGSFEYRMVADKGSETATINATNIYNNFAIATSTSVAAQNATGNVNSASVGTGGGDKTTPFVCQTVFVHGGGTADNGSDMFSAKSFAAYKNALGTKPATDEAYGVDAKSSPASTHHDKESHTMASKNFKKNGYYQSGWKGKTTPGGIASTDVTNTQAAGVAAQGGTLFLEPTWEESTYTITYEDNPNIAGNTPQKFDNCLKNYKMSDTTTLGAATNPAYNFVGWKVVKYTPGSSDTVNDAWVVSEGDELKKLYASEFVVTGLTGNVTLQPLWEAKTFYADFNLNGGVISGQPTYRIPYTIEAGFIFPSDVETPEHYKTPAKYKIVDRIGSWNDVTREYESGKESPKNYYGNVSFGTTYTPVDYTIKYVDQKGNRLGEQTYNFRDSFTLESYSTYGSVFDYWEVVETDGNWGVGTTYEAVTRDPGTLYGNVTLRCVLKAEEYKVTIQIDEAAGEAYTKPLELKYFYDSALSIPGVPTKAGYYFVGWEVVSATVTNHPKMWHTGEKFPENSDSSVYDKEVTLPSQRVGSVTIKPVWSAPRTYTITLDGAGGTVTPASISYNITQKITLPVATRDGYDFAGWQAVDSAGNWIKNDIYPAGDYNTNELNTVYGTVTLRAKWTERAYTVTYQLNNGTLNGSGENATQNYEIHSIKLAAPERTGYEFKGWKVISSDGNWEINKIYAADTTYTEKFGNVILSAEWDAIKYTITFPAESRLLPVEYTIEDTSLNLLSYAPDGYSFNYWYVSDVSGEGNWTKREKLGSVIDKKYGNIEVAVDGTPKTYNYVVVDIDGAEYKSGTYTINTAVELPAYEVNGYEFRYWKVQSVTDGEWASGAYNIGAVTGKGYGNVVFEPVVAIKNFDLTLIYDNGSATDVISYTIDDSVTLPKPTKTGHTFLGWEVTTAGGSWVANPDEYLDDGLVEGACYGNAVLTARWAKQTFTVTWIVDTKSMTTTVAYGEKAVIPDINTDKISDDYIYTFTGWSSDTEAPITGNTIFVAQYTKKVRTYTVTWYDEDGTTVLSSGSYAYGSTPSYNGDKLPVKASVTVNGSTIHYGFAGWDPAVASVTGDASYKAVFEVINSPVEVTWIVGNKTYTTFYEEGEMPEFIGTPVKPDDGMKYTFTGWDKEIVAADSNNENTYTALFAESKQTYTASLALNGGSFTGTGSTSVSYDIDGITLRELKLNGYKFIGWRVKEDAGMWEKDAVYKAGYHTGMWGNVDLEAVFEIVSYSITIKGITESFNYTINSDASILSFAGTGFEDSNPGYELSGWHVVNGEGSWYTGETVAKDKNVKGSYGDVAFKPVWTAKTYTITWVSGDIEQVSEVKYGAAVTVYSPVAITGYAAEWTEMTDEGSKPATIPAVMPARDLEFIASYSAIEYTIRFDVNGGDNYISNIYYTIESEEALPAPKRTGATFAGWKVTAGTGSWVKYAIHYDGEVLKESYGNVTLTAQWEFQLRTVTWKIGDVEIKTMWYDGAVPSYNGTPVKAPDERNTYEFDGWDKEITVITGDVTYTAQFRAIPRVYTVMWDIEGYIDESCTLYLNYGDMPVYTGIEPVRVPDANYEYKFSGWSPVVSAVTADVIYIAQFTRIAKLQGLRVDKSALFLDIGEETYVSAIMFPASATSNDVEWVSQNEDVAKIDVNGKITAIGAGSAIIRVQSKDNAFKSYCIVEVAPVITEYILVSAAGVSTTRRPGEAIQLYATIMPANATNKNVVWTSSNPLVADVDDNGFVVFGSEEGSAVITAVSDGYASGSITVTTTLDDNLIEDNVQTYAVMFLKSSSSYIINGETYENITVICREGDTLEFLLTQPHFATLNAVQFDRDVDGVYRIKDIDQNYTVYAVERADLGLETEPDNSDDEPQKETFFDKLKAFFRSIVEFFRNLFN